MPSTPFSIFDRMLEGVQVIDQTDRYLYVNDALVAHSKLSRSDLLGKTMGECYPGIEKTPVYSRIKECRAERKSQEWINEFDFPDGSKGFFQLRILPLDDSVLIMSFDVTMQKRAEVIVERTREYLEEVVKTRTRELEEQNVIIEQQLKSLKEINATKDKFFSIVAHDLVAPIQSLKGFTEILSAKAYGVNGGELAAVASNLQRSISQTLRLAENLILWAREQMQSETQVSLEKIKIEDIIVEVYGLYKELAERKDIELKYTADQALVASADKNQLSFVLRNLVNNAIKYTNPKGTVDIAARLHEDRIKISISDNGVGIQESTMINIRNLHRNKSRLGTLGEKGTGLGLMLCYEFIEQNSGSIEVESNPGYGSTFHVFLNRH